MLKQQKDIAKDILRKYEITDNSVSFTIIQNQPSGLNVIKNDDKITPGTFDSFTYQGQTTNTNRAIQSATELFKTAAGSSLEENSLLIFITNTSVNVMTSTEKTLLKDTVAKSVSIVFVVSGLLKEGTEAELVNTVGSRKNIIYIDDPTDVVDADLVNNVMQKGM